MGDNLLDYMTKLRNMADFLARGGIIEDDSIGTIIEIVDDEIVKHRNAFSIMEHSLYDELEASYYGEQRSLDILMEYIAEGIYEREIEGKVNFDEPYTPKPEEAEFYKRTMKKVNAILKIMSLSLVNGFRIPLSKSELIELKELYLEEEEFDSDENYEQEAFLIYDVKTRNFCAINSDNEKIVEDITIYDGMSLYNKFLVNEERTRLEEKAIKAVQKENKEQKNKKQDEEKDDYEK